MLLLVSPLGPKVNEGPCLLEWPSPKRQEVTNTAADVEKRTSVIRALGTSNDRHLLSLDYENVTTHHF